MAEGSRLGRPVLSLFHRPLFRGHRWRWVQGSFSCPVHGETAEEAGCGLVSLSVFRVKVFKAFAFLFSVSGCRGSMLCWASACYIDPILGAQGRSVGGAT